MNPQMNYAAQMKALQDRQRQEYNQLMGNMQNQYQQNLQALQNQFGNPFYPQQSSQPVQQPIAVQPSGNDQAPQPEVNRVPMQQLAMLSELKSLMTEIRDILKPPTVAEAPVEAEKPVETKSKTTKTK